MYYSDNNIDFISSLLKLIAKKDSEEEKQKLQIEKEKVKKIEEEFFTKYGTDLAKFKRNFFAGPFEKLFEIAAKCYIT